MVEDAIKRGLKRPMHLYWGARRQADLYMPELPQKWAARHAWFSFIPVLSEAEADWTGRRGLVHQDVLDDPADLSASRSEERRVGKACVSPCGYRGSPLIYK